jgi:hypothetical protein
MAISDVLTTREFLAHAQQTEGTVISLYAGPSHPDIEFADLQGQKHRFPGTGFISFKPGDRVKVAYLANDPHRKAQVDEPGSLWFSAANSGVLGLGLLIAGTYLVVRNKKAAHVDRT